MVAPSANRKSTYIFLALISLLFSTWFFNLTSLQQVSAAPDSGYEFVFFDEDWRPFWTAIQYGSAGGTPSDDFDPDPGQSDKIKTSVFYALWGKIEIETYEPHEYPVSSTFDALELELWGWDDGTSNGQRLAVALANGGTFGPEVNLVDYTGGAAIPAGSWQTVSIPLADLTVPGGTFDTIVIMPEQQSGTDFDANTNGRWFGFDNVRLVKNSSSSAPSCTSNQLGGTVFYDGNANGAWDQREQGYAGITVTAYNASGAVVGTPQTTDANGHYKINVANGTDVRVEFTGLPTGINSAAVGVDSESSVVFTTATGSCTVDYGVQAPTAYCDSNPEMATSCYVSGKADGSSASGGAANVDVLVSFDYDSEGQWFATGSTSDDPTHLAFASEMGSTWGLAHQSSTDTLYAAAMLKRHVGIGPSGLAGIYMVKSDNSVSEYVDLSDFSISAGTNPRDGSSGNETLPISRTLPSHDVAAYSLVGKAGLGDMDIDGDNTLWVVNLFDRNLYGIANANPDTAPVAGDILGGFPITASGVSCTSGELRPWAVKAHYDGLVYVGAVCSAENGGSEANLHAYILSIDPSNTAAGFTNVYDFSLNNKGGCVYAAIADTCGWNAWDSAYGIDLGTGFIYNPQPVFSDIEFDVDGSMILGFFDRAGHQFGVNNYEPNTSTTDTWYGISGGDLIRVCNNGGTYILENNGSCPGGAGTLGKDNGEGYGAGEYYQANFGQHQEVSQGGVAILFGTDEVAFTSMDPIQFNTSGVRWNSNTTGYENRGYEVAPSPEDVPGMLGKAAGIGDLELICQAAPMEIGNRLWCDANDNGKQDAGEAGVGAGVSVVLTCGNDSAVTVTTAADGTYSFTDVDYQAVNGTDIPRDTACNVTVDTVANASALNAACGTTDITTPNDGAGSGLNPDGDDLRDSDANDLGGGIVGISFVTGDDGENNHSLDFGFGDAAAATLDFGDLPDGSISADTAFPTSLADNGPRHTISSDLYLGSCVDADFDGSPDMDAGQDSFGGDDNFVGTVSGTCTDFDDEDGVTLATPLIPGAEACLDVTAASATGTALLNGWIDFNGDGDFVGDSAEKLTFTSINGSPVSTQDGLIVNGSATRQYCFDVPSDATFDGGETHMRFRVSTAGGLDATGAASDGEVEDYYAPLACVGNLVWQDTNTLNNVQDASDPGIPNLDVRLVWAGADDAITTTAADSTAQGDDRIYTVQTAADGTYSFCGLIPDATDTYRIDIPEAPTSFTLAVVPNSGQSGVDDVTTDSDGVQTTVGQPVTGPLFTIDDPINLYLNEDGESDNPGALNGTPDARDDLRFDFGFTAEGTAVGLGAQNASTTSSPLALVVVLAISLLSASGLMVRRRD